jgi:hypothetical protein
MKITALALALSFGLVSSMAAFAQTATPATPAAPAKPQVQTQTTPATPATPAKPAQTHANAKTKLDCHKAENKAKDECKVTHKATDKKGS